MVMQPNQMPWGYAPIGFDLSQMLGNMSNQFASGLNQSSQRTAEELRRMSDAWVRILNQAAREYFDDPLTSGGGGGGGFDEGRISAFIDDVAEKITDATENIEESTGQIESAFTPSDQ